MSLLKYSVLTALSDVLDMFPSLFYELEVIRIGYLVPHY